MCERYTYKDWISWYVNYISTKGGKYKEQREQPRRSCPNSDDRQLDLDQGVGGKVLGSGQMFRACLRGLTMAWKQERSEWLGLLTIWTRWERTEPFSKLRTGRWRWAGNHDLGSAPSPGPVRHLLGRDGCDRSSHLLPPRSFLERRLAPLPGLGPAANPCPNLASNAIFSLFITCRTVRPLSFQHKSPAEFYLAIKAVHFHLLHFIRKRFEIIYAMNTDQRELINIFQLIDVLNPICRTTWVTYKLCSVYTFLKLYPLYLFPAVSNVFHHCG